MGSPADIAAETAVGRSFVEPPVGIAVDIAAGIAPGTAADRNFAGIPASIAIGRYRSHRSARCFGCRFARRLVSCFVGSGVRS